jgi:hypothetical protein
MISSAGLDAWALLREAARPAPDGWRDLVPMVGTGFNARAGKNVSWLALLEQITRQKGLQKIKLPDGEGIIGNATFVWEAMLCEVAVLEQCKPHIAETRLQQVVADVLLDTYAIGGLTREFAATFLAYRFRDIISFNFDFGMLTEEPTWSEKEARRFDPLRSWARCGNGSRVWYPHGSVRRAQSIQLGVRLYGMQIEQLENARKVFKKSEDRVRQQLIRQGELRDPGTGSALPDERRKLWSAHRQNAESWLAAAMNAPILCVGLGMGREEWPLWWFFNQRERNHARRQIDIPIFVMLRRREADRLRVAADLGRLTLLEYDEYEEGWERLASALL